jgi:hypothetical protein
MGTARRKCDSSTAIWLCSCATLNDRAALAKIKDGAAGLGGRTTKQEIARSDSSVVNASLRDAEPLRDSVPRVGGQRTTEAMITMSSAARPSDIHASLGMANLAKNVCDFQPAWFNATIIPRSCMTVYKNNSHYQIEIEAVSPSCRRFFGYEPRRLKRPAKIRSFDEIGKASRTLDTSGTP